MKRVLVIAVLATAAVAVATVAYAAIPSANGLISACKTKDGAIKLIDKEAGQACPGSQELVEWNQQGPAGSPGQNGVSGYGRTLAKSALDSTGTKSVTVHCPSGTKALGGGAGVYGPPVNGGSLPISGVGLAMSQPAPFQPGAWTARAQEFVPTALPWSLEVWAVCADVE
jgi:hypothetical protein